MDFFCQTLHVSSILYAASSTTVTAAVTVECGAHFPTILKSHLVQRFSNVQLNERCACTSDIAIETCFALRWKSKVFRFFYSHIQWKERKKKQIWKNKKKNQNERKVPFACGLHQPGWSIWLSRLSMLYAKRNHIIENSRTLYNNNMNRVNQFCEVSIKPMIKNIRH